MKTDKKTSNPVLDAVAGGLSGALARVVVGPLDVVKIRFQVQLEPVKAGAESVFKSKYTGLRQALLTIFREEGIPGLWRGTVPGLMMTVPYTAVQFTVLQQLHSAAGSLGIDKGAWATPVAFLSGAGAGAAATMASYPFDLLRTTLAAQGEPRLYRGMGDAARGIVRENGVRGLYRGLGVTLVEIIPYAALQFGLYDTFTRMYTSARKGRSRQAGSELREAGSDVIPNFLCGLAAGTLAKLGTHPLDVAKKRFQVAGLKRPTSYGAQIPRQYAQSLPGALLQIWRREGLMGLYKGVWPSLLKAAPQAAVTFTSYEYFLVGLSVLLQSRAQQPGRASQLPAPHLSRYHGDPAGPTVSLLVPSDVAADSKPRRRRWWPLFPHKS